MTPRLRWWILACSLAISVGFFLLMNLDTRPGVGGFLSPFRETTWVERLLESLLAIPVGAVGGAFLGLLITISIDLGETIGRWVRFR